MATRVAPITDADLDEVARFLHAEMNSDVPAAAWRRSFDTFDHPGPNHGFLLRDTEGDRLVGVYAAYYSTRVVRGEPVGVCNLGVWCVLPSHRLHSVRLLKALVSQEGWSFVDLSPSGAVIPLNERLGFRFLDTTTALVPALPWPWRPGSVSADPAVIEATLTGADLALYRDHRHAAAARHLVLRRGDRHCYVVFRMDRRKGLPRVFATVLHVGDPELFAAMTRPLAGHLLLRHGALALLTELRVVRRRPFGSILLGSSRRKMFRSPTLGADDVDYFYSELVSVSW
ncbi:MAG TPA: hypothetical protein VGD67_00165 [Pseudonocardiaceae bacterium]